MMYCTTKYTKTETENLFFYFNTVVSFYPIDGAGDLLSTKLFFSCGGPALVYLTFG